MTSLPNTKVVHPIHRIGEMQRSEKLRDCQKEFHLIQQSWFPTLRVVSETPFIQLQSYQTKRRTAMLPSEIVDDIIAYESGDLNFEEVVNLFQNLVDTGLAWSLQGAYGRMATDLLEEGLIQPFPRVEK